MLQTFEAQTEDAERNLDFGERGQRLAQVRTHQHRAGHAGDVIRTTGKFLCVFPTIAPGVLLHLLERFGRANDRTMLIVHGHGAQADRYLVSLFVLQKTDGFCGLRCLDGAGDRAILVAELASRLVAMQDRFRDTRVAYDFMPQAARDALGPVAPEHNFLLQVDHAYAGGQAIDYAATNVSVMK
jgi:hypothetical protein